jgi:hypothetical protein
MRRLQDRSTRAQALALLAIVALAAAGIPQLAAGQTAYCYTSKTGERICVTDGVPVLLPTPSGQPGAPPSPGGGNNIGERGGVDPDYEPPKRERGFSLPSRGSPKEAVPRERPPRSSPPQGSSGASSR